MNRKSKTKKMNRNRKQKNVKNNKKNRKKSRKKKTSYSFLDENSNRNNKSNRM